MTNAEIAAEIRRLLKQIDAVPHADEIGETELGERMGRLHARLDDTMSGKAGQIATALERLGELEQRKPKRFEISLMIYGDKDWFQPPLIFDTKLAEREWRFNFPDYGVSGVRVTAAEQEAEDE